MIKNTDLEQILTSPNAGNHCDERDTNIIFKEVDHDSTGNLSMKELKIFFEEQGYELEDKEILGMMKLVDAQ